jgi:glycogen debranching enzyme
VRSGENLPHSSEPLPFKSEYATLKVNGCADRVNLPDSNQEWLETNGIGGFSSSTVTGMNTRRYHGLLVAATKPPVGRAVLLSKLEETLILGGDRFDLSTNQFSSLIHPRGFEYLTEFRLDPAPVWIWDVNGTRVTKTLSMVQGQNGVVVDYEIGNPDCQFEIRPLIAFRDYHATTHANDALNCSLAIEPGVTSLQPYVGLPRLYFKHNAVELEPHGSWYYGFQYEREKERGLDFLEDLYNPFTLRFSSGKVSIAASTTRDCGPPTPRTKPKPGLVPALTMAASQFIVDRGPFKSVIAGYHWFGDWGRDTMVSLPGLTLATGRPDLARNILLAFSGFVDQGMLPNRFPDGGEPPEYNTVDATLWFFEAVRAYVEHTGDSGFVHDHLYAVLKDIVNWHVRGTRFGIRLDSDGLLEAGGQLTWMDARGVTPREGKAVEIQALWHNALCILEDFAELFQDADTRTNARDLANRANVSFNAKFWNESAKCLYDVVIGDRCDQSIRPNQIIAVGLHHGMLSEDRSKEVLAVVERELLTPFGLRTLSPRDPRYRPRYEGGPQERDAAYHQGTVWPWLIGPFITAYVKADGRSGAALTKAREWLEGFTPQLQQAGLGQMSEIFDGDPPHTPRGCIAQAWSVAELLRIAELLQEPETSTKT